MADIKEVTIRWNDTKEEETVLFGIGEFNPTMDDEVFFWVDSEDELKEPVSSDFDIVRTTTITVTYVRRYYKAKTFEIEVADDEEDVIDFLDDIEENWEEVHGQDLEFEDTEILIG